MMMLNLRESGHHVFRATSALDRGFLESKKGGKLSIHFFGDLSNSELLFRTFICCQPAQCLRSYLGLVLRIGSANL